MQPEVAAALRAELLSDEGKRLKVYDDDSGKSITKGSTLLGYPTIGIGRCLSTRGITDPESEMLFSNDLIAIEQDLIGMSWIRTLTPRRQMVIYSLYFNTSLGNPRHFVAAWPNFLGQMAKGFYTQAAQNLRSSQPWASQVGERAVRFANAVEYG